MRNFFQHFFLFTTVIILSACSKLEDKNPFVDKCSQAEKAAQQILILNNFEKNKFKDLLDSRFFQFKDLFVEAENLTDIEWEFLAAISFQESQWDPKAQSNMGVRGMMMLTRDTAKSLGISNRIDPKNSVIGGATHLSNILNSIDYGLTESDKVNFALATYNLGATNVNNAIAKSNIAPDLLRWDDLKKELLIIDGDDLYFKTQTGYSRGQQVIDYVERINEYYILMSIYSCKGLTNQLTAASGT